MSLHDDLREAREALGRVQALNEEARQLMVESGMHTSDSSDDEASDETQGFIEYLKLFHTCHK